MLLNRIDRFFSQSKKLQNFGVVWYGVIGVMAFASLTIVIYGLCNNILFPDFRSVIIENVLVYIFGFIGYRIFGRAARKRFETNSQDIV